MKSSYNLSNGTVKVSSNFNSGVLRPKELYWKEGKYLFAERIFESWDSIYKNIDSYIVDSNAYSAHAEAFEFKGLATKFSRLRNAEDIKEFASQYGMLGFTSPSPEKAAAYLKTGNLSSLDLHTPSVIEPINIWMDAIAQVKRLLQLYRALVKLHRRQIDMVEENLLTNRIISETQNDTFHFGTLSIDYEVTNYYNVCWVNGPQTNVFLDEISLVSMKPEEIYRKVLIDEITKMIDRSNVVISPKIIHSPKAALGMNIIEVPYTSFLITAIYYDLWRMLSKETQIEICANDECNLPFMKSKNQIYCSDACKQAAYRQRKRA